MVGNYRYEIDWPKEELQERLERCAERLECHPDVVFGKVVDLTNELNQPLIAAAPDLLEACKDALAILEYGSREGWVDDSGNDFLRQAIAKAEGE